jgi:transcriptional regulator with XRE-family HTH domain
MAWRVIAKANNVNRHVTAEGDSPMDTILTVPSPPHGEERNELLRTLIRALIAADYGDSMRALARAMNVAPSTLANFLSGDRGGGMKILDGVARVLRRDPGQILSAGGDLAALRAAPPSPAAPTRFADQPNWLELQESARGLAPTVPPWAWESLGQSTVWLSTPITPALCAALAEVIWRHVPPPPSR